MHGTAAGHRENNLVWSEERDSFFRSQCSKILKPLLLRDVCICENRLHREQTC